jgi:hypothetical protein
VTKTWILAAVLALMTVQTPASADCEGLVCGTWLEEASSAPGFVTINILTHIVGCTNPVRTVTIEPEGAFAIFMGTDRFQVRAARGGTFTVTVTDFCSCPGFPCTVCGTITVDIPAVE